MALKKRVPVKAAPAAPKALPKRTAPVIQPKGVARDAQESTKAKKQERPAARPIAPQPPVASKRPHTESRPSEAPARAPEAEQETKQLTYNEMRALSIKEKVTLWRYLNDGITEEFVTIIRTNELPKKHNMRLLEAQKRGIIGAIPKEKNIEVHYCGYCVAWMPYMNHAWTGYRKCCGCSISTKDFYTSADNNLFNKD